ncbi:MAG: LysM peptidoglycan-binding domain-containing protein [Deltaproteobacteria bacterium]|nr:LysM peptidoglycan-binding domain-containing protein [Deltaproteobacteria bacterium]
MRRSAAVVVVIASLGALGGLGGRADAQPDLKAGPQVAPPVRAQDPSLTSLDDHRRNIRGCAVGETCLRPADVLREFEMERMPPPGADPWINEHRAAPPSRLEARTVRQVKKPSELRPDAPWLDTLALPDLPVRWSKQLVDYLVFYRDDPRGRSIMQSWIVDQGRYRDLIVAHLRKARLPEDLLYVAMIESSYDPNELSSAGALGVWQWMPEGAKIYGLRRDHWVDERRDPLRSTIAQMDYFKDLYQRFGDWHIALAAFNVGYGAVLRSVARYNTNDIYQLCEYENAIPWETCWYTPKVLATAIVGRNRAAFGLDKVKVKASEVWEDVAVPASLPLGLIAQAANVSEADILKLNPHLRHGRTPPGEAGYIVRVPPGTRADTQRRIAELQSQWSGFDAYVVAHGERFEDVAMVHGITVAQLRKLNDMTHDSEIQGGSVLVVPRITEDQRQKGRAKARAALHTSGVDQKPGELLIVPIPDKDATVAGKRRVFYRVVVGDTLAGVARAFALPGAEIAKWNQLDEDAKLHPRMVLVMWVPPSFDAESRRVTLLDEAALAVVTRGSAEHLDMQETRLGRVRTEYVAQGREKVADIARRFGLGSHDLARINRISYDATLQKGDKIIVYQVADASRSERAAEQLRKTPRGMRGKVVGQRATTSASLARDDDETDEGTGDDPQPSRPPTTVRGGYFPVPR